MSIFKIISDFVNKEIAALGKLLKSGEKELLAVATTANAILNATKAWTQTPGGKTLISVLESIPTVGPIAKQVVDTILPIAITASTTIMAQSDDPEALITTGVNAIWGKTDADAVAGAFTTAQAIITNKIAPLLGVASTFNTAISVAPAVYAASK